MSRPTTATATNVIVLTIDTLRADRLSLYGYDRPTTPNLERLADEAIVCRRAFTHGPFTHNACPQIFTSSRPFSYGGYSRHADRRPTTLFKAFQNAGFHTTGLANVHWVNRFYGYDGLDVEVPLFTLNTLVGMTVVQISDALQLLHAGAIPIAEAAERIRPSVDWLFRTADTYCDLQMEHQESLRRDFPDIILVRAAYDYRKVKRITRRHRETFADDPLAYINRYLTTIPASHEWIASEWRYCRTYDKLLREGALRGVGKIAGKFVPDVEQKRKSRTLYYPDARSLVDRIVRAVDAAPADRPFFVWAHFKDTHEPYVSGYGRSWSSMTPQRLAALGYDPAIDPTITFRPRGPRNEVERAEFSALYDAAIRSTDEAIGRLVAAIDDRQLGDNTIIALCADHGEELGEHGDFGHTCHFYEHNVRVPMLFRRKGMAPAAIEGFVSLLDFAPTLADLAGIAAPDRWEGRSMLAEPPAIDDAVIMETFCRGSCTFDHRPVYLGVRTATHKFIWKEFRDRNDRYGIDGHELYELAADPGERTNIYAPDHPVVTQYMPRLAARMAEVPEIADERIVKAFGELGTAAIRTKRGPGRDPAPT